MGKTFAEKILAGRSGNTSVNVGQIVTIRPDHLLTHDNTAAIIGKISKELDQYGLVNPDLNIIVLDHVIPAASEKNASGHKVIREFVNKYGIKNFFDIGEGICHQVVFEKGFTKPGKVILGSDSHTCSYGAAGVFSSGIDRTEAAALMLTGETWLKVPPTIKITLNGSLQHPVSAKDLGAEARGPREESGSYVRGDLLGLHVQEDASRHQRPQCLPRRPGLAPEERIAPRRGMSGG